MNLTMALVFYIRQQRISRNRLHWPLLHKALSA